MRMMCAQILNISPSDLYVPGEILLSPYYFRKPVRLGVITSNDGAREVAETLQSVVQSRQRRQSFEVVDYVSDSKLSSPKPTHVLLYLNQSTFTDAAGDATASAVNEIMNSSKLTIVKVHEYDPNRLGCSWSEIVRNTRGKVNDQVRLHCNEQNADAH